MIQYKSNNWPTEHAEFDQQNIVARAPQSASAAVTSFTSTIPQGGSTVVAAPDALPPPVPVPIGAIVGGACGGVALVVLAVIGWRWWGICIRNDVIRARRKKRARQISSAPPYRGALAAKVEKTQSESSVIREKPTTSGAKLPSAGDKKVKFAPSSGRSTRKPEERSATASPQSLIPKPSSPKPLAGKKLQRPRHARTSSRESRTYSTTRSSPSRKDFKGNGQASEQIAASPAPPVPPIPTEVKINMDSQNSGKLLVDAPPLPTPMMTSTSMSENSQMLSPPPPSEQANSFETLVGPPSRGLNVANIVANGIRRLSTLTRSSGSIYSRTSSGEEISRRWSWLFVTPPSILGGRGSMIRNRSSGASSSRTNGSSRVQVGYAYGGDDNDDYDDNDIASDDSDMDSEEQYFDCEEPYGTDSHV